MKQGFTLVELSIVLVIIGLLVGGTLVAQSLVHAAKINAVARELQQYDAATATFISKYRQIPGDTILFDHPGNKDGIIALAGSSYEFDSFWYHLSLGVGLKNSAGGGFGYNQYPETLSDIGKPSRLHIQNSEFLWDAGAGTPGWLAGSNLRGMNHTYVFADAAYGQYGSYKDTLLPETLMSLDQKLDDGMPNTGNMRADYADSQGPGGGGRVPCGVDSSGNPAVKTNPAAKYDVTGVYRKDPCSLYVAVGFNSEVTH